jgi:hypothetical protein
LNAGIERELAGFGLDRDEGVLEFDSFRDNGCRRENGRRAGQCRFCTGRAIDSRKGGCERLEIEFQDVRHVRGCDRGDLMEDHIHGLTN